IPWDLFQPPPPWLSALMPLLPDLPTYFPGQNLTAGGSHHHIIESLGNFLLTLARRQPLVLFLDNLHWADAPSWNFLGYLAQRIVQMPLLIIGTARAEDMPSERGRLLRKMQRNQFMMKRTLQRLSQTETNALVGSLMSENNIDPVFLHRIYEETEGNPFFIIETVRAVREAGGDWTESVPTDASGKRPFFAIPMQVQAVIEARLDKLSEESRGALGVAAAIGREFSFQLLQEVSQYDTETLLNALDEWLGRGLVRETRDGYDFTHEKLSQIAYQQLSRARRQWIHRQIADLLTAELPATNPAQLAHHYYLSSEPGLALPYLAQAGQRALGVRSYAEAREFGLRAIGLLGRTQRLWGSAVTERIDLNLQLAQAYAFTGGLPKALQMLREAERMAEVQGDIGRLVRIFRRSAQIFWLQGTPVAADDYARRTLRHAEELDDARLRFAALRMLGRVNIVRSQYDDAIAYLLRYIDLAERGSSQTDLPAVYGYLGVAYARVGSWQRALDAAQKGVDLASVEVAGAMPIVARMQLAFVYAELREWEQALAVAEPLSDSWREEGMTPYAFMLRTVNGRCLAQLHGKPEGVAEIESALQWAEEVDYRVQVHLVQLYLAQAQFRLDQKEVALEMAQLATAKAAAVGDRWAEAIGLRTQAEIAVRLPQPDWVGIERQLVNSASNLRRIRARPDLARTFLALRRLYDRAGQTAWAVDCHFRATTIFEELGMGEELREAQGQAAGDRVGAVVIPGLKLVGPNEFHDG
ncbi:MAG: AAA family ATPase, partial [Anaerolineales bacterium]|nr:AAA family ATPase [Anaerolineales bacterium]